MKRITVILCALILAGCQSRPGRKYPPKYPKSEPTAVDPVLQARATVELASALSSEDEVIRCNAVEVVKDVTPADAETRIAVALADRSLLVRKAACMAIGELKLKSLKDRLPAPYNELDQLPSSAGNDAVTEATQERIAAIFAMTACGDDRHTLELTDFAKDPRVFVRRDAVWVLGLIGNKSAVPLLFNVLHNDKDRMVRVLTAAAMWRLGSADGEKALVTAVQIGEPALQIQAILGLAQPRDKKEIWYAMDHCADAPPDGYVEVGLVATRACGLLGSDVGYGVALDGAKSVDPVQRQLAAMAFAAIGRSDDQPVLAKLLEDKNQMVRIAAARGILMLVREPG